MKSFLIIIISFLVATSSMAASAVDKKKRDQAFKESKKPWRYQGQSLKEQIKDSFYDPKHDYSTFTGRVTDRDDTASIVKISSENRNIKFFRSGDMVRFRLASKNTKKCRGYVRSVEEEYFVLYVQDITLCWGSGRYFRRGAMLVFSADMLASRVRDASTFRIVLLKRRSDFYKQLNDVNHFVWSYDQEKVILASEFDEKITALRAAKQKAMDMLQVKKKDSFNLQRELVYRLDQLEEDLEFYRIDKDDPKIDRWHLDHDLGKPVSKRPAKLKFRDY